MEDESLYTTRSKYFLPFWYTHFGSDVVFPCNANWLLDISCSYGLGDVVSLESDELFGFRSDEFHEGDEARLVEVILVDALVRFGIDDADGLLVGEATILCCRSYLWLGVGAHE